MARKFFMYDGSYTLTGAVAAAHSFWTDNPDIFDSFEISLGGEAAMVIGVNALTIKNVGESGFCFATHEFYWGVHEGKTFPVWDLVDHHRCNNADDVDAIIRMWVKKNGRTQ